jgi:hypothetical protein
MKKIHLFSLILGVMLGLVLAGILPFAQRALAEDDKYKGGLTKAEYAKKIEDFTAKVDQAIASQQKLQEHLKLIQDQSEFLKKATGK